MRKWTFNECVRWSIWRILKSTDEQTEQSLWFVLRTAAQHRGLVIASFAINIFAAVFEWGSMGILAVAVASVVGSPTESGGLDLPLIGEQLTQWRGSLGRETYFLLLVSLAVVGQVFRSAIQYAGTVITSYLRARIHKDVVMRVVKSTMEMSYAEVSKYPSGALNEYVIRGQVANNLISTLNALISQSLLILAYLVLLVMISWEMVAASAIALVGFSVLLTGLIRQIKSLGKKKAQAFLQFRINNVELMQMPRLLRTFCLEQTAINALWSSLKKGVNAQRKANLLSGLILPLSESVTVVIGAVLLVAGYLLLGGGSTETLPTLLAFLFVLQRMMSRTSALNSARSSLANKLPEAFVVAKFLDGRGKEFTRVGGYQIGNFESEIRFENTTFKYAAKPDNVVIDLNFTIKKGQVVAFVGRSGSGKSTVIDLLTGLYEPTSGSVMMDDIKVDKVDVKGWRKKFGVVSQENAMFNQSIRDNIRYGKLDSDDAEIEQAAKAAHAHEFILELPEGYSTVIGERAHRLSGGQIQRLALARAIIGESDILVLDEATSALDTISEKMIMRSINELRGKKTIVIVAHRLSTVVDADLIIVLDEGRIVDKGTHAELLSEGGAYSILWELQTRSGFQSLDAVSKWYAQKEITKS